MLSSFCPVNDSYVGWYSNRGRGARPAKGATTVSTGSPEVLSEFAQRAKAVWARLIRKIYEVDPLERTR